MTEKKGKELFMTMAAKTTKKKVLPNPAKRRSFKAALESTNKKFAGTLAKLAK